MRPLGVLKWACATPEVDAPQSERIEARRWPGRGRMARSSLVLVYPHGAHANLTPSMEKHRVGPERSLILHREVARRLLERPDLVDRARSRVADWRESGSVSDTYVDAWEKVLDGPASRVAEAIVAETEYHDALRQVSPFAGVIDPRTRWLLLKTAGAPRKP